MEIKSWTHVQFLYTCNFITFTNHEIRRKPGNTCDNNSGQEKKMFRLCNPNKLGNNIYIYIRKHNLTNISIPIEPTTLGILKWRNTRSAYWIYRAQATTNRKDNENSQYIITNAKFKINLFFHMRIGSSTALYRFFFWLCVAVPYIWYMDHIFDI